MKVLYLSNIEVPYRVSFFNELSKHVKLTVLYERKRSDDRDLLWSKSVKGGCNVEFLEGIKLGADNSFSFDVCSVLDRGWDVVLVGCVNSFVQLFAMGYMRAKKIPYFINLDGEFFLRDDIKSKIKLRVLKSACGCLIAGERAGMVLRKKMGGDVCIKPYYFSSLNRYEVELNIKHQVTRENYVLLVGRYLDVKGLDVAFRAASMDSNIRYKFVGMGNRTEQFRKDMGDIPPNIEIIPFLQKEDLEEEYKKCSLLLLPSRQECWGLVINEAASFGTPIVSTWGCGAAVEFLSGKYEKYLAEIGSAESLLKCIKACIESNKTEYSNYLKEMSKKYTIERMVECHVSAFNQMLICR